MCRLRLLYCCLLGLSFAIASEAAGLIPGRGLGERPATPKEQIAIDAAYRQVSSVPSNDLAWARVRAEIRAAEARGETAPARDGLPTSVDNSTLQYFPPIRSQGNQGSCTAWASCYYYNTYTQALDEGFDVSGGDNDHICSPGFMYPLTNDGFDEGASLEYAMLKVCDVGCSSWTLKPYSESDYTSWPTEAAWVNALNNRTSDAYEIDGSTESGLAAIKQHLANGNLATTSFDVYETYYYDYPLDNPGIDNDVYYATDGAYLGGHAVTLVGYDDAKSYVDHRDAQTHYGAFLIANSWDNDWGVPNSTGIGGSGFFWVAYEMFLEKTFGPWADYTSDRPDYRPRLYGVTGLNHPERWDLVLYGGAGNPLAWLSQDVLWYDGGTIPIADDKRVAIDLTDGIPYLGYPAYTFIEVYNDDWDEIDATMTSADFYVDLDEDGSYSTYSSTDPPLIIPWYDYNYAECIIGHEFGVYANAPAPATVMSEGTVSLSATYADTGGHGVATWSWSDGGAGGSFSPSDSVQNPTYTAPTNVGGADVIVTLTVSATCDGAGALSDSDSTTLVVEPLITGSIAGTISDALSSAPIDGALVTCGAHSTTTNGAGEYLLTDVPVGSGYTVTASADGYQSGSQTGVTVTADVPATVDLSLVPLPGAIAGTVTEAASGLPISGVTVACGSTSDTTVADGTYTLPDIPVGDGYTVTASGSTHLAASQSGISVASQETTTVNFQLKPASGAIAGRVVDAATELPIAWAAVECDGRSVTSAQDGWYRFGDLRAGQTYAMSASADFHETASKNASVVKNATTRVDLALVATGTGGIAGRVTDADTDAGIAGALVTCGRLSAETDSDGSYSLANVPAGTASAVGASAGGYVWQAARSVVVDTGSVTTVDFALTPLPAEGATFETIQYEGGWWPHAVGAAWGDYDEDGYPDLFLTGSPGGLPNVRLLRNQGDLTFADVGGAVGIYGATTGATDGVAWADYDSDGDLDVLVSGDGGVYDKLYRNDGAFFTDVAAAAGFTTTDPGRTVSWCDYDGDNRLDVFVSYVSYPGYDVAGRLYRNNGNGTFTDVSASVGMGGSDRPLYAFGSHWGDYDNDGWSDLLVSSWNLPPMLYHNEGDGTFTEVSTAANLTGLSGGTGAAWGDYDNDGWLDAYVVASGTVRDALFHNNGDGTFTNVAGTAGMAGDTFKANGVSWADYNNDGFQDIVVGGDSNTTVVLYHNDGDGTFTNAAAGSGLVPPQHSGATVWADIDLDGRLDLFHAGDPDSVMSHNIGAGGNWLRVRAVTDGDGDACDADPADSRDALGARVELNVDNDDGFLPGRTITRVIDGGSGFLGQNEPIAQFGVPTNGPVAVRVFFPDGSVVTHRDVSLNAQIEIRDVSDDRVTEAFPDVPLDCWAYDQINACVEAGVVAGYDDARYHGDWPVTRDQMAVYIARALAGGEDSVPAGPGEATFEDVPTDYWAYDQVEYCYDQNVVRGYTATTYAPTVEVTRDQMAVYVARALVAPTGEAALADYEPADPRNFPDVPTTGYGVDGTEPFWAYRHIEYCVAQAIVQGYLDGLYHPETVVTRDQMAVYVARAFGL